MIEGVVVVLGSPLPRDGASESAAKHNQLESEGYPAQQADPCIQANNSLNDVKLSQNAKCVLESCHIPNITNMTSNSVLLRINASSEYKTFDTSKKLNGNPIILTTISQSNNLIYNASDTFYSVNVSSNFLSTGYIELELECPNASSDIDFITNTPLKNFYISLVIIDIDPELTKDLTLAPPIDYNNYNVNMPIRNY